MPGSSGSHPLPAILKPAGRSATGTVPPSAPLVSTPHQGRGSQRHMRGRTGRSRRLFRPTLTRPSGAPAPLARSSRVGPRPARRRGADELARLAPQPGAVGLPVVVPGVFIWLSDAIIPDSATRLALLEHGRPVIETFNPADIHAGTMTSHRDRVAGRAGRAVRHRRRPQRRPAPGPRRPAGRFGAGRHRPGRRAGHGRLPGGCGACLRRLPVGRVGCGEPADRRNLRAARRPALADPHRAVGARWGLSSSSPSWIGHASNTALTLGGADHEGDPHQPGATTIGAADVPRRLCRRLWPALRPERRADGLCRPATRHFGGDVGGQQSRSYAGS